MAFPPEFLEELRGRITLSSVVGRRVKLAKKGREFSGLCPFHNEKSPSFFVNDDKAFYHCFAGETEVITWEGVKPIRELAGGTHRLLTRGGVWVDAPVKAYGEQRLMRIELGRNGVTKSIFATDEHRWFLRGQKHAVFTRNLKPGNRLEAVFPALQQIEPSVEGVRHGIVFGDGTLNDRYALVNLHGEKGPELRGWFEGLPQGDYSRENQEPFVQVRNLPKIYKSLPSLSEPPEYLAGFVAGYLATDGHVAKDGTIMLNCMDESVLRHVRDICTRIGLGTHGITSQERLGYGKEPTAIFRIHFVTSHFSASMLLRREALLRWQEHSKAFGRHRWSVKSVTATDRLEDVYCAEVPGEAAFVLADNILTGNCFGCGKHGDAVSFVIDTEGLGFREAVERLAGEAGMEVPTEAPVDREVQVRRQGAEAACEAAAAYFQEQLRTNDGKDALDYLIRRGVTQQDISHHRLGWAPDRREGLKQSLIAKGFTEDVLIEAGLIILPEDRPGTYDRFRGRVMFPIADRRGRVVAFGGRAMGDAQPKYLNSPETSLFHKGRTLYALHHARVAAARAGQAIVVEGYMDVVAMHRGGFQTAVAPLGTALTEEQMGELWKLAPEPILCLDGDSAGQRAMARAAERALPLLKPGKSLRFATLPDGLDPDDLLRQPGGAERLRQALDAAIPLIEALWRIEAAVHPLDTPERKAEFKVRMRERVSAIKDGDVKGFYGQEIATRLSAMFGEAVPEQRGSFGRQRAFTKGPRKPWRGREEEGTFLKALPESARHAGAIVGAEQAKELLLLLVFNPELAEEMLESLADLTFADAALDSLRQEIINLTAARPGLDAGTLQTYLMEGGNALTLQQVTKPDVLSMYPLARPGAYLPDARTRARVLLASLKRDRLQADLDEAKAMLTSEASAEAWMRVQRLTAQIAAAEQE